MARKLPWDRKGQRSLSQQSSSSRQVASPHTRPNAKKARTAATSHAYRSPSTSPPPEPPTESFMIDGLDQDDQYRIVEDELLEVARTFTAHLHAAEYKRSKAQVQKQGNQKALRSMTRLVRNAPKSSSAIEKQSRAKHAGGHDGKNERNDSGDDSPWTGTSLAGLMEGGLPKDAKVLLPRVTSRPGSQASQWSVHSTVVKRTTVGHDGADTESDNDDDDLDGPPVSAEAQRDDDDLDGPPSPEARRDHGVNKRKAPLNRTVSFKTAVQTFPARPLDELDEEDQKSDIDGLDTATIMRQIRQRRAQQKAERQRARQQRHP